MGILATTEEPNWARISEEWEQSGMTQREFCERRGLSYSLFSSTRGLMRKRERELARLYPDKARLGDKDEFLPITIESEPVAQEKPMKISSKREPELEVALPYGVVLRFYGLGGRS